MSSRILVLHGPPLAFLLDLPAVDRALQQQAQRLAVEVRTFSASGEAALLEELLRQRGWLDGVLVNPGSLAPIAHALADALEAVGKPAVEVLLEHESKHGRGRSALRQVVDKQFHGQGTEGYTRALEALAVTRPTPVKTLGPRDVPEAPSGAPARRASKTIGSRGRRCPAPHAGQGRGSPRRRAAALPGWRPVAAGGAAARAGPHAGAPGAGRAGRLGPAAVGGGVGRGAGGGGGARGAGGRAADAGGLHRGL
jgi:3-dehydroquinate dehydratase II